MSNPSPTPAAPRCRRCLALAGVAVFAACTAPQPEAMHVKPGIDRTAGAEFVSMRVHQGIPILQKSFFWDGNGEVDNTGFGVHWGHFVSEHLALGVGSNLVTWWTGGRDVHSAEFEGLIRIYPKHEWPIYLSGTGGYQLADDQIPPGGTVWNFSFSFGAGVDVPLSAATSALFAVDYHHISNALGRENPRNPSQNEARVWVGLGWSF